jgi:hypothetical protein
VSSRPTVWPSALVFDGVAPGSVCERELHVYYSSRHSTTVPAVDLRCEDGKILGWKVVGQSTTVSKVTMPFRLGAADDLGEVVLRTAVTVLSIPRRSVAHLKLACGVATYEYDIPIEVTPAAAVSPAVRHVVFSADNFSTGSLAQTVPICVTVPARLTIIESPPWCRCQINTSRSPPQLTVGIDRDSASGYMSGAILIGDPDRPAHQARLTVHVVPPA